MQLTASIVALETWIALTDLRVKIACAYVIMVKKVLIAVGWHVLWTALQDLAMAFVTRFDLFSQSYGVLFTLVISSNLSSI
jgi:hypothetical protein